MLICPTVSRTTGEVRYTVYHQDKIWPLSLEHGFPIMGPGKLVDVQKYLAGHLHMPYDWWRAIPIPPDLCPVCLGMPHLMPGGKYCDACQGTGKRLTGGH